MINNEFAQLVQMLVTGQPPSQLMQSGVAPAGGAPTQLIEVVTVSQPAGQPQVGYVVPGAGQRADDLDGFLRPGPVAIASPNEKPCHQARRHAEARAQS